MEPTSDLSEEATSIRTARMGFWRGTGNGDHLLSPPGDPGTDGSPQGVAPDPCGRPSSRDSFKREIAALGRCDHPNVVKVLTAGRDGDRHYYAMEHVEGCDLAGVFRVCLAKTPSAPR